MKLNSPRTTSLDDRVPFWRKAGYGTGMLGYALLIQVYMQFYNPVFNDTLGLSPVLIAWIISLSRVWDSITDPLMGNISDNTYSRFGRRRPWIALGAFVCSLSFIAIWWFPRGFDPNFYFWWLLISSLVFYLAFTVFSVPYIALGMELSPDYHERTSVMTMRTVIEQFGFFVVSSLFYLTSLDLFTDRAEGMRYNSLWVAVIIFIVIMVPAVFAREHPSFLVAKNKNESRRKAPPKVALFTSVKETLGCWPFLNLGLITVFSYFGVITVGSLGYYVTVYYQFDGDKSTASGTLLTLVGYFIPISAMIGLPLMNMLSKKIGKRYAMIFCFGLTSLGAVLRWYMYTPESPYLSIVPTIVFGIGTAGAYLFINAMIPEAVDADELRTGIRREGMFSAVYGWTYKLGAALAILLSGYVLQWTGFDTELGGNQAPETIYWLRFSFAWVGAVCMLVTTVLAFTYPITERKAYEIREQLAKARKLKSLEDPNSV